MLNMQAVEVREKLEDLLHQEVIKMSEKPNLTVIQVGDNQASNVYVRNKVKACKRVGIDSSVIKLPIEVSQKELIRIINILNDNDKVHGILVQLPLPKHINENRICEAISPLKDVDCFNPTNIGKISTYAGHTDPCTPRGIITLLKYYNVVLEGARVVVVGRSNIVGKPLTLMLINEGCTVTSCNSKTKDLKSITKQADIVITAIGKPKYFTKDYFSKNCIVVDVGINKDEDNKLCGDVDYNDVYPNVKGITPVPKGVGLMTVITLLQNTINCYRKINGER